MKYRAAALAAAVALFAIVTSGPDGPPPRRPVPAAPLRAQEEASSLTIERGCRNPEAESEIVATSRPNPSPPSAAGDPLLEMLKRELLPTPEQWTQFETVMRERAAEIEAVHARIAEAKVFSRGHYSATIRAIRARSYERIAAVLDAAQNQRFRERIAERRLGDAVAITIEPDWLVTD